MPDENVNVAPSKSVKYPRKIHATVVYNWLLLFLVAVIAFGILATWIRLGTMMDANHPYLAAIHGVYINESGKPEIRMVRVDKSGFIGVLPVGQPGQQGNPGQPGTQGISPVPVPSMPAEVPANKPK
jgi:hypothetical protein